MKIDDILKDNTRFIGEAEAQIDKVSTKAQEIISRYPKKATYEPQKIL